LFLLSVGALELLLLLLSLSRSNRDSLLLFVPVLLHLDAAITHIVTLEDLGVPELIDGGHLIVLGVGHVGGDLIQVQGSLSLVTVGHVLLQLALLAVFNNLEAEVGDGRGREVDSLRRLV